ncbi:MAG: Hint domain-containing protein [Rhodobacteraceae bacterium]|nr:Hint domain-containing protein [Paracoccaceae bacterium]
MSSVSGFNGVYAVDWAQTAPGDEWGLSPDFMAVGMSWRWRGRARRLDAPRETLWLDTPIDRADPRQKARARMRRLALAEMPDEARDTSQAEPEAQPDTLSLTDGHRVFHARLVRHDGRLLAVFHPLMPPADHELWICALNLADPARPRRMGVICFLPGTRIATTKGPRAIETLEPGALVETRDNGARPVIWRGETRLSGAELYLYPHLRPLRIRAGALSDQRPQEDLLVSPGHRLLMPAPHSAWSDGEVLIAAEDLEDGRGIRRDFTLTSVRYVHLMLERHEILTANGQPCESFHPGLADARVLSWHARSLEKVHAGLASDPARYGETARRCLDRGEAEILRHALA